MKRTLVVGDIHGAYKAFLQVLDRAGYDREEDTLILLGDLADGWPETAQLIDYVLSLPNTILLKGNHDYWLYEYLHHGDTKPLWTSQGGQASLLSYASAKFDQEAHMNLLRDAKLYHKQGNDLFVHGGFNWRIDIENQGEHELMWDRHLIQTAYMWQKNIYRGHDAITVPGYDRVFIGHTTTSHIDSSLKPVKLSNVWCLDQGAGYEGKLTIMDVATEQYWQSDIVKELYPDHEHR